jgi:hypothetical protein
MIDSAQKRGELIGHLEAALELADELNGCPYRKPKTADRDRESADTRSR